MPKSMHKHDHFWWSNFGAGMGFLLAAAMLLWVLLNDWARLIRR